jgi:hypothetical protein
VLFTESMLNERPIFDHHTCFMRRNYSYDFGNGDIFCTSWFEKLSLRIHLMQKRTNYTFNHVRCEIRIFQATSINSFVFFHFSSTIKDTFTSYSILHYTCVMSINANLKQHYLHDNQNKTYLSFYFSLTA